LEVDRDAGSQEIAGCRACYSKLYDGYFELDDCAFVVVEIAVVWCGKDGNDCWELFLPSPMIHLEAIGLCLMSPNDGQK
jgi:hypothetical protein